MYEFNPLVHLTGNQAGQRDQRGGQQQRCGQWRPGRGGRGGRQGHR